MNKVRCMLNESESPKSFCVEAAYTACYLINSSPSTTLDFKVPKEMWSGVAPNYSRVKTFGCLAYVHISEGKLNPRAKKCTVLGYPQGVKAFRIWLLKERKCVISRDVIFNEHIFYKTNM